MSTDIHLVFSRYIWSHIVPMQQSCLSQFAEEQSDLPRPLPHIPPPRGGHHRHLHREEHPFQGADTRAAFHTHGCW